MNVANGYHGAGTSSSLDVVEDLHVRRQRSMKFSLYPEASRPRTASKGSIPDGPTTPISPVAPQIPQFLPAREESLLYQRPFTSHHSPSQESRAYPSPAVQHNLPKKQSEASRLR